MPDRDWYAEWLLGEVMPLCPQGVLLHEATDGTWYAEQYRFKGASGHGDSAAEALAALYRYLTGTEPPPRPTEEEVRAFQSKHAIWSAGDVSAFAHSAKVEYRMMARAVVEIPMGGGRAPQ